MDGEAKALIAMGVWFAGIFCTWGYFYSQCSPTTKQADEIMCASVGAVFWPAALPANISYRIFN